MGLLDRFLDKRLENKTQELVAQVTKQVVTHVDDSLVKAGASSGMGSALPTGGLKRYQFTQDMVNGGLQSRKKPGSNISFETLRRFSTSHEVTRACINLRKRQITGLEWDIVTADHNDTGNYDKQAQELKNFFKNLGGTGTNYRKFMDRFIEDIMVLDAVAIEKQKNRGEGLANLIPIDASTIRLRVDESGATPEPPEIAYVQVIRGVQTAELTTEEMIYEMMNPRNDSPYGLAPLESLMIIVSSSLKAGMYNLAYLTDGNTPEGIFTMPDTWNPQQIKDFQEYFDALMAGDETMTRRLKFMPDGTYTATNKPSDMAFQEFNDWLMKITCALFEITPSELGFSPKSGLGGKGFSEEQREVTERKGIAPMANLIEEIFTRVIQEDLGYPNLAFQYTGLIEHDEKSVAEVNEILIRSGQRTVNELRTDDGLDAIDGLDKPFYAGQVTFLDEESQNAKQDAAAAVQSQLQNPPANGQEEDQTKQPPAKAVDEPGGANKRDTGERHVELVTELRTFRKYALARHKSGKPIRAFESNVLPSKVTSELNERVQKATDESEVKAIFSEYMQDYQVKFLSDVDKLRKQVAEVI